MSSGCGARLTRLVQTCAQRYRAPRHFCQSVHNLVMCAIPKYSSGEIWVFKHFSVGHYTMLYNVWTWHCWQFYSLCCSFLSSRRSLLPPCCIKSSSWLLVVLLLCVPGAVPIPVFPTCLTRCYDAYGHLWWIGQLCVDGLQLGDVLG